MQNNPITDAELAELVAGIGLINGYEIRTKTYERDLHEYERQNDDASGKNQLHSRIALDRHIAEMGPHWLQYARFLQDELRKYGNALPGLLARLAAETRQKEAVQDFVQSLFNDLLNHPEIAPSIHAKLWQLRQQLTVKGGQPRA